MRLLVVAALLIGGCTGERKFREQRAYRPADEWHARRRAGLAAEPSADCQRLHELLVGLWDCPRYGHAKLDVAIGEQLEAMLQIDAADYSTICRITASRIATRATSFDCHL